MSWVGASLSGAVDAAYYYVDNMVAVVVWSVGKGAGATGG